MEPGSEEPGDHGDVTAVAGLGGASMEPGSEEPGDVRWDAGFRLVARPASMSRAPKSPVTRVADTDLFAHYRLQWSRAPKSPVTWDLTDEQRAEAVASMEPGSEEPGDVVKQPHLWPLVRCFNEPGSEEPVTTTPGRCSSTPASFNGAGLRRAR